jgi:hypothetical protein
MHSDLFMIIHIWEKGVTLVVSEQVGLSGHVVESTAYLCDSVVVLFLSIVAVLM